MNDVDEIQWWKDSFMLASEEVEYLEESLRLIQAITGDKNILDITDDALCR